MGRLLGSVLFEVSPGDPGTLAGVSTLLLLLVAGASFLPSRRATRVDPVEALRAD
jgi:ABC-type lipoprotein release transport system permease subunit